MCRSRVSLADRKDWRNKRVRKLLQDIGLLDVELGDGPEVDALVDDFPILLLLPRCWGQNVERLLALADAPPHRQPPLVGLDVGGVRTLDEDQHLVVPTEAMKP